MSEYAAIIAFLIGLAYGLLFGWCAGRVAR